MRESDIELIKKRFPTAYRLATAAQTTVEQRLRESDEAHDAIVASIKADTEREREKRIRQLTHEELHHDDLQHRGAEEQRDGEENHQCSSVSICGSNDNEESECVSGSAGASPSHCTILGTPISPRWSEDWIDLVNETEARLERRCCGAHAPDDLPCELQSTHESGRCRFHGGVANSGAQKGNANARLHGLYSKRLQRCGTHCAKWKTCPHGGDDVKALPEAKRPYCPYEVEELEALRELDRSAHERYVPLEERTLHELRKPPYPVYTQLLMQRENLNMLQVMISRALRVVSAQGFETEGVRQSENRFETIPKLNPAFQAYTMLMREFRLAVQTYNKMVAQYGMPKYERP